MGLMVRTQLNNMAPEALSHATPSRKTAANPAERIAAIAIDATRDAPAPTPKRQAFRRPEGRQPRGPGKLAHDVRRKNLGAKGMPNPDGKTRMRLTDKPNTKYKDVYPDGQAALATRLGIHSESDWETRGKEICPLCKRRDHYLWHCVKVWAATAAGQKWLGDAKAAEFVARLKIDEGVTLTMGELMAILEEEYESISADAQEAMVESLCFVCDYCEIDCDEPEQPATELLALTQHLRHSTSDALFEPTAQH